MIGAWRSLVAHLHGVQGVGGSNPLAPIVHPYGFLLEAHPLAQHVEFMFGSFRDTF